MTKIQAIISEIDRLDKEEMEIVLKMLIDRIEKSDKKIAALKKYRGIGKGIWRTDAQQYINQLREEDRL